MCLGVSLWKQCQQRSGRFRLMHRQWWQTLGIYPIIQRNYIWRHSGRTKHGLAVCGEQECEDWDDKRIYPCRGMHSLVRSTQSCDEQLFLHVDTALNHWISTQAVYLTSTLLWVLYYHSSSSFYLLFTKYCILPSPLFSPLCCSFVAVATEQLTDANLFLVKNSRWKKISKSVENKQQGLCRTNLRFKKELGDFFLVFNVLCFACFCHSHTCAGCLGPLTTTHI